MSPKNQRPRKKISDGLWLVKTDDGSLTLFDEQVGETFHSESGAATESRTVFLENSGVQTLLDSGEPTRVLEIGLGTGLNFLLTAGLAIRNQTPLEYWSSDTRVLPVEILGHLELAKIAGEAGLIEAFSDWMSAAADSDASGNVSRQLGVVSFDFQRGDARDWMPPGTFDAIYFDAFSPTASGELWTVEYFGRLRESLKSGGRLVTYCVRRAVQDAFRAAGFEVEKHPGPPGGKREVLVAVSARSSASMLE
ncbi:MAG: tRNA (5-methylaminomethyl-2-thiouridine)(34)-methyltransferase MnmD [Pirellulaceae bacterium]|nr:tRNA (5-methylaminomethyl-2-thiouridine)(34)-methyltransferase MnmD [Pirellulaceae bacterium]